MDLIERLRERVRTLKFGDHTYSLTVAANDPLRLEAAAELERLTADNAALRADAVRYGTIDLLHANGDVRIAFDEDGSRVGVHLEEAAECADQSWFGDDLDAAVDAATKSICEEDAAMTKEPTNG